MFVFHCPHCGEKREEEEFGYGGEAFIARPEAPEAIGEEAWGDYLFMRKNPRHPYILVNDAPKVRALSQLMPKLVKG